MTEATPRKRHSKKTREEVAEKTGWRCHMCGDDLKPKKLVLDHVVPHVQGGECNPKTDLLATCETCNRLRWQASPKEMRTFLRLARYVATYVLDKEERKDAGKAPDEVAEAIKALYAKNVKTANKNSARKNRDAVLVRALRGGRKQRKKKVKAAKSKET